MIQPMTGFHERPVNRSGVRKHKWMRESMARPDASIKNTMICVKCGLGRGVMRENFNFNKTVYFVPEKILSMDKIPFFCGDEWIGDSFPISSNKPDFICEEEFKV